MPSPRRGQKFCPSGGAIYAGMLPPVPQGLPLWAADSPLNGWVEIPGTNTFPGQTARAINSWSGFAFRPDTSEIFIACPGGHDDGQVNNVISIRLTDDAPSWVERCPPSPVTPYNVFYGDDGKPVSRHLYNHIHWVPGINRVVLAGARFISGVGPPQGGNIDSFDPVTSTWSAPGTHPSFVGGFGTVVDGDNNVWTGALQRWNSSTNVLSSPAVTNAGAWYSRFPVAFDSVSNFIFSLQWADGERFSAPGVNSCAMDLSVSPPVVKAITYNASAALTRFIADQPQDAGMTYDPVNNKFYFYDGAIDTKRIFRVTPNSGSVWDMDFLPVGGAVTPPLVPGAGINSRFKYVPALKGLVMLPNGTSNLYFMRTA